MDRYGLIKHVYNENFVDISKTLDFFLDYAKTPDPEKDLSLFYGLWILKQVPRLDSILRFLNERPYAVYKDIEKCTPTKADYTLKQLLHLGLIDRPHKGVYEISKSGKWLLLQIDRVEASLEN